MRHDLGCADLGRVAGYEQLSRDDLLGLLAERDRLIDELREKIERLERLVSRNSGNSSFPPSMDDLPGRAAPRGKPRRGGGKRDDTATVARCQYMTQRRRHAAR